MYCNRYTIEVMHNVIGNASRIEAMGDRRKVSPYLTSNKLTMGVL